MNPFRPFLGAVLSVALADALLAQNPTYPPQPAGAPQITSDPTPQRALAARNMRASRASGPISIDGKLDEASWKAAVPSSDFMQSYPKVGGTPTDRTEVRVLYDDDALYVGVR